ncbi:NLI interacting factor-like phosphatase-domain-containing protein [Infundibulicybe gibba]|nr:NLI interacting factor-like phosphatase-domain-containing protein [Infundibulicybe gibba]
MNSLAYLSRQFDILASTKTPSTPTSEHLPFGVDKRKKWSEAGSDPPLQRVKTWSSRSFLLPLPSGSGIPPPKRSRSSPALVPRQPVPPPSSPMLSSLETPPRSKEHIEILIRRVFFIRVFMAVWDNMSAAWSSFVRTVIRLERKREVAVLEAQRAGTEEKESSEDEESISSVDEPCVSPPPIQPSTSIPHISRHPGDLTQPSEGETGMRSPTLNRPPALPTPPPSPAPIILQSLDSPSRSATPILNARRTPFHLPKTLVLDLDETLIHSTSRADYRSTTGGSGLLGLGSFSQRNKGAGLTIEVVLGGRSTVYHVYKRPFVDFFLRTVSGWYTLVIFTASMQEYADPVIDWLDAGRGILAHRLFRDSCTQLPNGYTKDLSIVEADLARVCLVDNSPSSYCLNQANGIPIEGWTSDPSDEALLDLLPVLDSLRFTSDVRRVLGLRSAGVSS